MSQDAESKRHEAELFALIKELGPVFQRMCVTFRAQPEIATADLVTLRRLLLFIVDSLSIEIDRRSSAPS